MDFINRKHMCNLIISSQIISTIVVNLTPEGKPPPTLYSSAKIKPALFEKEPRRKWRAGGQLSGSEMSEGEVIFREGEFLSGRQDPMHRMVHLVR